MLVALAVHLPEGHRVQPAARPRWRLEGKAAIEEGVTKLPGPRMLRSGPQPDQAAQLISNL